MSNLVVSVPHQLSQDEALKRIQHAIHQFYTQHSDKAHVTETWRGYAGTFTVSGQGQQLPTTVTVNPADVTVEATLPGLAMTFKPRIEAMLRDVLTKALA